jgi:hypothetical protein
LLDFVVGIGWPANFYVGSDQHFMDMCLHE